MGLVNLLMILWSRFFVCSCGVILVMVLLSSLFSFFLVMDFFLCYRLVWLSIVIGSDCVNLYQFNIIGNITLHGATIQYFAKRDPIRNPYC
jgi:hypothetical protein